MASNVPFTQLDFDTIKDNLKVYLSSQEQFKDYNFDGSNMSVLLDVLAYNTFQNNFYTNMAFSEMFLDSAQLRDSIVSHAKELNYLPRSRRSARAVIDVQLAVGNGAKSVTIPRNTKFDATCGNKTFSFYNEDAVVVIPVDGLYEYTDLDVYEGVNVTEAFEVTEVNQTYPITNATVDTNSIRVTVRDNTNQTSERTEYTFSSTVYGLTPDDAIFYIQPYQDDQYAIAFGQDQFGMEPPVGSVIEIEYRTTKGSNANGSRNFVAADEISGYSSVVTTVSRGEGGAGIEGKRSIKFFAPKSIQVQDRAVTESDYEILLKSTYSEIQAVSVFGGEELDPPRYGRVVVAVDVKNADGVSEASKTKFTDFLLKRCPIGIEPLVISPLFMFLSVDTSVTYDVDSTRKSASDISDLVEDAIDDFSDEELADFKLTFRFSRFTNAVDEADDSIISNDSTVLMMIPTYPTLDVSHTIKFEFNNALTPDRVLSTVDTLEGYKYAVKTSAFRYNETRAFIQDDGDGALHILANRGDDIVYLKRDIGTVDYDTGEITVTNIVVDSYTGTELAFYGRSEIRDIVAPKDRIISIRNDDVTVTVIGESTR